MGKGISSTLECGTRANCLARAGIDFVARYYFSVGKNKDKLSRIEAEALSSSKIALVAVYENGPTKPKYFSFNQGHGDGFDAYRYARDVIHQTAKSAIYFAVDYDARPLDISNVINEYFRGFAQGFVDAARGEPAYQIGVYGSGLCCSWLRNHNSAVKFSWMALSNRWAGSNTYSDWNIRQSFMPSELCGLRVYPGEPDNNDAENNVIQGEFGQFTIAV
jgi:hypothetical protein